MEPNAADKPAFVVENANVPCGWVESVIQPVSEAQLVYRFEPE
jgi:hypothetical protein